MPPPLAPTASASTVEPSALLLDTADTRVARSPQNHAYSPAHAVGGIHTAVLGLPGVCRRIAYSDLPSQFRHFAPSLVLLQHPDDLLFGEPPLLHGWISLSSSFSLRRFSRSSILTGRDYRGQVSGSPR